MKHLFWHYIGIDFQYLVFYEQFKFYITELFGEFSVSFAAGLLDWSLISLINLVASLLFRFAGPKRGNVFGPGLE